MTSPRRLSTEAFLPENNNSDSNKESDLISVDIHSDKSNESSADNTAIEAFLELVKNVHRDRYVNAGVLLTVLSSMGAGAYLILEYQTPNSIIEGALSMVGGSIASTLAKCCIKTSRQLIEAKPEYSSARNSALELLKKYRVGIYNDTNPFEIADALKKLQPRINNSAQRISNSNSSFFSVNSNEEKSREGSRSNDAPEIRKSCWARCCPS
jgi:hypothetical protein